MQDVAAALERSDLGGQRPVVEQQRRVGEPDGGLRDVLHLDEDVDRPVQLGQRRRFELGGRWQRGRAGDLADQVHALLRPLVHEDVAVGDDGVGPRVELPVAAAADRQEPHPGLGGQGQVAKGRTDGRGSLAHLHASGDLVGVPQVGAERVGDAEPRADHAADVGGGVADLVDRVRDPQDALDRLGVLGAPGREDRQRAQAPEVAAHALLEVLDLVGEVLLVEEQGGVCEVDEQLGGVLRLDKELLDVPGFVVSHARSRRTEG